MDLHSTLQLVWVPAVVGWLGGVHCVAMCGGFVAAVGAATPSCSSAVSGRSTGLLHQLAFNSGRIVSYAAGGAVAGALGSAASHTLVVHPAQWVLRALAAIFMVAVGLHLSGIASWARPIERIGGRLFARVAVIARRWIPLRRARHAFPVGLLWGWMPCGSVYAAFALAALTGSAVRGTMVAVAFGLGTLPWLLLVGMFSRPAASWLSRPTVRVAAGLLVCGMGVFNGLGAVQSMGWLPGAPMHSNPADHCATQSMPGVVQPVR